MAPVAGFSGSQPIPGPPVVLGRDAELARIGAWLSADAAEPVLIVEGQPGIGKTTLWALAVGRARLAGWQVLSGRPVPSDAGLPNVGLADLLRPVPGSVLEALPPPQRRPLAVAVLREDAGPGDLDPRAVGLGLTALLGLLADRGPLMLAIDDAQWLDPASARNLAFALRRAAGERLRLAAAVRTDGPPGRRTGAFAAIEESMGRDALARLPVGPLTMAAIQQLLRHATGASFPRPVLVRIHQASAGNPFYALEIARELLRVGSPPPGEPLPVPDDHRDLALLRLRRLARPTRDALAVMAASPGSSATGLEPADLDSAERAGIIRLAPGGRPEFSHPLFGSALYSSLPEAARRTLHRQLAGRAATPEERARHLALAAEGPDEATAAELDAAAAAASARGAADVAVELKELAFRLTPARDRDAAVRRRIELADRRYFAGDPAGARRELEQTLAGLPPGDDRARVMLELGSVLWAQAEVAKGTELMVGALKETTSRPLLGRIHSRICALSDDSDFSVEHGQAALDLLDEHADPQLYSFALHNVALFRLYAGLGADHEAVGKGMRLQQDAAAWEMSTVPAFWARNFDDFATARQRFGDLVTALSEQGDEANMAGLLSHLAVIEALTGRMDRARALARESVDLAGRTEQEAMLNMALLARAEVCVRAGDLAESRRLAHEVLTRLDSHPDIVFAYRASYVLGQAALTAGDLKEADRRLSAADTILESLHTREPANNRFHADHAEAVIGLGDLDRAERLVSRLEERAARLPRPWVAAVSARCRGLLQLARGDLDGALASYQLALRAHDALEMPAERGRTLLVLGRLHRRRGERLLAADRLRQALAAFQAAGAAGWAEVAAAELAQAGTRRGGSGELTPTERKICELAVTGLRNGEIAARLFLSAKTVEANLSRAYRKLGVRSRTELASPLTGGEGREAQPGKPAFTA